MIKARRVATQVTAWLAQSREGRVHSLFARACNLSWGDGLISLVLPEHGMVPGGISVSLSGEEGWPFLPGDPVMWNPLTRRLGPIDLGGASAWENRPPLRRVDSPEAIARRVSAAAAVARVAGRGQLLRALPGDLAFPTGGDPLEWSTYAWAPMQALLRASATGDEAGFEAPLQALVGLGEGLTPSGDDFVLGLMAVLHYGGAPGGPALAQAAVRYAHRTTPISGNYLRLAAAGGFSERLETLALALLSADGGDAAAAARSLIETGHSSGTDSLVGAILGSTIYE